MIPSDGASTADAPRWTVVANPAAGRGRGKRALVSTGAALADGGVVIAVGGDGLIGAVAGAIAGPDGAMGIVPAGRGNDSARSLGLPLDHAGAARMLAGARRRWKPSR